MIRARWTSAVAAASLGFAVGCMSLCDRPLLSRFRARPAACDCVDAGALPITNGPVLEGPGPFVGPPPTPVMNGTMPLAPQAHVPLLSPPPRLVPQAQPVPASP